MDLSTSDWTQLIAALALALVFFVIAYVTPPRISVSLLVVLAPFQIIASRFGTLNIALIYLVGVAHVFRGRIRALPFVAFFGFIFFAYLLSMSQTPPATYFDHALYLIGVGADVVLFYVVYNYIRQTGNVRQLMNVFVTMNILILCYCLVQLVTGQQHFAFLGIREFEFGDEAKQRLVGPFGSPGTNGEVFVLQLLLLGYLALHARTARSRYLLTGMVLANFAFLVMTESRGSFLTLIGGGLLFLWLFRHRLGFGRVIRIATLSLTAFAVVSVIVLNYTRFNLLYERLGQTTFNEGIPDTRQLAFKYAWERIPENALLGHGPQLRLIDEQKRVIPGHQFLYFPHDLYLFLALTIGVVGLVAYLLFFLGMYSWWRRAQRRPPSGDAFLDGLPTLGILLLLTFLVDQLKIEFLRSQFSDHQQYMFALWAMLLAATARRPRAAVTDDGLAASQPAGS